MDEKKQSGLGIAGMILGIISLVLGCILIGGITGVIGLVISAVAMSDKRKKHTITILGIVLNSIAIIIATITFFSAVKDGAFDSEPIESYKPSVSTQKESETYSVTEPPISLTAEPTISPTPEPTPTAVPTLSKEEYIAECEEIEYKSLMRTPEDYVGRKIEITVKIEQIIQGGWFDNNQYYRVYTNDEYGFWLGNEYFMYDSRIDNDMKILVDDVIKVYGEFVGLETVTRALTNTKDEIPAFEAVYIELISE